MQFRVLVRTYEPENEQQTELLKLLAEKLCLARAAGSLESEYFRSITRIVGPKQTSAHAIDKICKLVCRTYEEIDAIYSAHPELLEAKNNKPIFLPFDFS